MNYYQVESSRALNTLRDGSPNFLHTFGAIVAGANEYVVVESTFPAARKYQPLMSIVITNNSGENLDLEINGTAAAPIPAGVIWSQRDSPVWSFRITNNDATNVASGEVAANLQTPPMTQSQFTRLDELYGD
jgi:hypothetical protein|tara:strand:- start:1318 stop:1713 length:396 start_codon:yes stop_codon:yes gene_type:complete